MRHHTRRRVWVGRIATVAVFAAMLVGGILPAGTLSDAYADPKRCTDEFGTPDREPDLSGLPGFRPGGRYQWRSQGDTARTYRYNNPRIALNGLPAPTASQLRSVEPDPKKYENATPEHAWASWKKNQLGTRPYGGTFEEYINNKYITGEGNQARGSSYEREVAEYFELGGDDWYCQYSIATEEPELFAEISAEILEDLIEELGEERGRERYEKIRKTDRIYDAYKRTGAQRPILEIKSGRGGTNEWQLRFDQKMQQKSPGARVSYIHSDKPTPATQRNLANRGLSSYQHRAVPKAEFTPGPHTRKETAFNKPGGARVSTGPGSEMARNSGNTPEAARRIANVRNTTPVPRPNFRPGGIDFTTMELQYISEPVRGEGMDYGFRADLNEDEADPSWGGGAVLDLASDSMFTWLALHPSRFWVNLNPDTPDQIVDEKLGRTDAGRVLLEADLEMKHDLARIMVPDNPIGNELWDSFRHENGAPCYKSYRYFIEPAPAVVREERGRLYILDAPMDVKAEELEVSNWQCDQPEDIQEYNFERIQEIAIPELEKVVNSAPQYADLRRVYKSRIAAEWIKERDAERPGDFHDIIGSDDASPWPSRTEWDPEAIYADYLESYNEGDFHFTREYEQDGSVLEFEFALGGVIFTEQPKQNMPKERFEAEYPELPVTAQQSVNSTLRYEDSESAILGGNNRFTGSAPEPSPTPTPDPSGEPTGGTSPPDPAPGPTDTGDGPPVLAATGPASAGQYAITSGLLVGAGVLLFVTAYLIRRRRATQDRWAGTPDRSS